MQDAEVSRGPIIKNPYLSIFKAIPLPAILIRANAPDFTVENANDAYTELSGKPREELVGKNLFELFPDNPNDSASDSVKRMTTQLRAVIETGQESSKNVERYDIEVGDTGNFEERYYNYTLTPFSGENGETEYILQVVEEVTDKVLLDREHNLLFNESEASFVLVGRDKKIVNFNREFELLYKSLTGKLPEKNSPAVDLVQSERHDKVEQVFERTLRGETTIYELEFPVENGDSRYFKIKYKPAIDSEGNIFGVVVTHKEITNERAAVKKLEENEARFRALVEQGNDVLFVLSPEGTPTYISPSIENVLGYTAEEAKRIDIFSSVHPDDIPHVQTELGKCLEQPGVPIHVTPARMKHKDGSWRWFDGTITNMLHDPAINGIVDNFHEITHRVEMEEKLNQARKRYKSIIQSIDGVFWEAKIDTFEFTFISPQVKKMLGYSPEEWLAEPDFWKNRIHPKDRDFAVNYCHHETVKGKNHEFEYRFKKADGSYLWLKDVVSVIKKDGRPELLRGLLLDITDRKEHEKLKRAEQEKYRSIFENSLVAFMVTKPDGSIIEANRAACNLFGYTEDEIRDIGRNGLIDPESPQLSEKLRERAETGSATGELIAIHKSGDKIPCEFSSVIFKDINGDTLSTVMMVDITDRKYYQENLLSANAMLKERIREQRCIYTISQLDEQKLSIESLLSKAVDIIPLGFQYPGHAAVSIRWKEQLYQTENFRDTPWQLNEKSRRFKDAPFLITVCYIEGKPQSDHSLFSDEERALLASVKDQLAVKIEKILQKKELQQRNDYIAATINNLPIGVSTHKISDGKITVTNPKFEEIYGWPKESFDSILGFYEHVYPDEENQKNQKERILSDMESGDPERMQWNGIEITTQRGRKKIINAKNISLPEQGLMISTVVDVTAEKEREKRLRELSLVASKTTDAVIITDAEEKITWVNNALTTLSGLKIDECRGLNLLDLLQGPDTDNAEKKRIKQAITRKESVEEAVLSYKKDGSSYWLEIKIDPIFNKKGQCTHFIAIVRDATEKIEREQELKRTLERYEIVSKATSDTIWDFDLADDMMLYNNNIHIMFGYKHGEVSNVASWWRNKIHPDDQLHVSQALRNAIAFKEDRFQMEYRFRCADGTYKNIYDRAFLIKDESDEPVRIIGAMQDITNMVEEQEQMKLLQSVVTNTNESVIISEANPDSRPGRNIVYVNNAFTAMTGYTADETISHSTDFLIGATTNSEKRQEFLSVLKKGRISEMENIYYRKDGGKIWVHTSGVPVENRSGVCTHWVFISRDITDQKAQEEKILSSLKEKETLLAEIHHRVKNNLAVVSSLMELQSMNSENSELQSQLMSSVLRIKSMATIHEQLYQSNSFSKLQFSKGLKQLIQNVIDTLQTNTRIELEFDLDDVELSINQGIPCSLLVNEIVTNILKHGFGYRNTGRISVVLRQAGDMIFVEVKDDGCGLPDDFGVSENNSMGLQLIELLTQQLKGEKDFHSGKYGTTFTLKFSKHEGKGIGSSFIQ